MTVENDEAEKAAGYFQRPSFNALERLVCSHLIEGINATPLDTTLHTMQAALLLDVKALDNLDIDREQVLSIYTVAQRLAAAKPVTPSDQDPQYYSVHTRTLDFDKDVLPWVKAKCYPYFMSRPFVQSGNTYRASGFDHTEYREAVENASHKEAFDLANQTLTLSGYEMLVSDFLEYATPLVQTIGGKLAGTVSPESYLELFRLIKGDKP